MTTQYIGIYDVSCFGEDDGLATVEVSGAHAPYSYEWYGPNSYVSANDTITDLLAGFYSVTVRDTNDCVVNSSINLIEPDLIYFTILGYLDESCLGACDGEIEVDLSGGVSPYASIMIDASLGTTTTAIMGLANDSIVSGLCSGAYTLAFTDENGCPSTLINGGVNQQIISTNNITDAQIDISSSSTILCNGSATGQLEALSPNTNIGYNYSWQDLTGNVVSVTSIASNLLAGTYILYADYNAIIGCTTTDTATVTELSIINPSAIITHVDCYGNATGFLQGTVQGGTSPYNMLWNPGSMTGASVGSLLAGTYTLNITDSELVDSELGGKYFKFNDSFFRILS